MVVSGRMSGVTRGRAREGVALMTEAVCGGVEGSVIKAHLADNRL